MSTFLQLKNATANTLGKSDGGTANTIRDNHINDVIRNEIADAFPFSWLRKTNSAIILDANGQADLPSDYNPSHRLFDFRIAPTGSSNDTVFSPVNREAFDSFYGLTNRYYVDYNISTALYRVTSTSTSTTVQVIYYYKPAIMTADTDVCPVPDQDVVAYLAAARYWLSSERDETNFDRFKTLGVQKLQQLIMNDKKANPQRLRRGSVWGANLGWNVRG